MKKIKRCLALFCICITMIGLTACSTYEDKLEGSWYEKGGSKAVVTFYSDGTCEIINNYGTGKWSIVNDDLLKITNFYGETETYTIVSIKNGCLKLYSEVYDVESSLYDKP